MFGSRNSLSQAKPELDSDEDDDICGSRNSLSGLKRWTTEENLSFTDPRGSRSELMEVPLNDSHSNSTGELYFAISRKKRKCNGTKNVCLIRTKVTILIIINTF